MSNRKISWKKVLLTTVWILVGAGTIVLLVAAVQQQEGKLCKSVEISVYSLDGVEYVNKKQILATMGVGMTGELTGTPVHSFDLKQMEERLEKNLWIRNAELFFDNNDVLHADITERQPVARVFSVSGETFYVDDFGERLPVNTDQVARVPVFTSFPTITYPLKGKDSVLLVQVKEMGSYLLKHDFWMAQIDQLNINNYEFELVPKLGKHMILFGAGTQVDAKFKRLLLFYNKIMSKTGWNYYSTLDVRYDKQLVAARRDSVSLFKSFVLTTDTTYKNTIETGSLLPGDSSSVLPPSSKPDSVTTAAPVTNSPKPSSVSVNTSVPKQNNNALKNQSPAPVQKTKTSVPVTPDEASVLSEAKKQMVKPAVPKKEPKAVMQKKNN